MVLSSVARSEGWEGGESYDNEGETKNESLLTQFFGVTQRFFFLGSLNSIFIIK